MMLAALIIPAAGADLNAPVERRIKIKSEIMRGSWSKIDCLPSTSTRRVRDHVELDWVPFDTCISKIMSEEIRRNTFTDPFKLGLYVESYKTLENIRNVNLSFHGRDLRGEKAFVNAERFYYKAQSDLSNLLGLSSEDVCRALADREHEATAKCDPLAPPP